jgi:hypothetical protein
MRGLARSYHCPTSAATTAIRKPANTPASVKSGTAELRTLQNALPAHGSLSMMDLYQLDKRTVRRLLFCRRDGTTPSNPLAPQRTTTLTADTSSADNAEVRALDS